MLIMLLIYTLKKTFKSSRSLEMTAVFKKLLFNFKYIIPFFLLSTTSSDNTVTEVENISFKIIKKNSSIGYIYIEKTSINQTTTYIINSEVNTKVIFNFNAIGNEKSIYKEDTLIFSSVFRKLNNKVKVNQSLSFINGKYYLNLADKKESIGIDIITRNIVTLFFFEPVGIDTVYSDKQNKMLNIYQVGNRKYKVAFSKSKYNIFHYENGKCTMIEAVGSFFKVKLIPTHHQIFNRSES